MEATEHIDAMERTHEDWRGTVFAEGRRLILAVDPEIVEEWKYMGAPVWSRHGTFIVGNIFKTKVKFGFLWGASLADPDGLFNGELGGNQRRSVEFAEGDQMRPEAFQRLVRSAIDLNASRKRR